MPSPNAQLPVIVGVGEITDRPADPMAGLEPLGLMAEALRRAEEDAGAALIDKIQSIDVVNLVSWRYRDPPRELCSWLGIEPARAAYHPAGGESPLRFLQEAAIAIWRGDIDVAAVCGAEAQSSATKASRQGLTLPWTPYASDVPRMPSGIDAVHPAAVRLGVRAPITIYPFYEQGSGAAWGQTPREALEESGALWARYAQVAAGNSVAWIRHAIDGAPITTPTPDNRLISWPYTKMMVANPSVNQGAAMILTSYGRARALGISPDRMIFLVGGAAAVEPRDFMARDQYWCSHAQDAVLERALQLGGEAGFDHFELYSCFPCVPKMARRTLGLGADFCPTVAGGLTFHGAPLNNYMSHAASVMVRLLREGGGAGLLYGQGEFVTKHHALILSASPERAAASLADYSVQAEADRRRRPVPAITEQASGAATVESYTVLYDPSGEPSHGVVLLRDADGGRAIAKVAISDRASLSRLTDLDRTAVGAIGEFWQAGDSFQFAFAS